MQTIERHTHKYIRVKGRRGRIRYKCSIPGCPHVLEPEVAVGRFSICNHCGDTFVMNKESVTLAKPRCENCRKSPRKENRAKILELLGEK